MNRCAAGVALLTILGCLTATAHGQAPDTSFDWQIPNDKVKLPFEKEVPITFVSRSQARAEWDKLPTYWNLVDETVPHPITGKAVQRKAVKIKLPLGITQAPPVPLENPLTVAKWNLGKKLYFDPVLSSNGTVSCASCHDPQRGYTDQARVSTGINGLLGGMNAPTVINSAFNFQQFWDGRAASLEEQCQGPPQNPVEMFDGKGNAWHLAVQRIRQKDSYTAEFMQVFGHEPTRDAIAKAIAAYERTVLVGNSIFDRADAAMRDRVEEEESTKFEIQPKDFAKVIKDAFARKDVNALTALKLDPAKDAGKIDEVAGQLSLGRQLYFGKARCSTCHVGENFTDNQYHNLGVASKDGKHAHHMLGRYGSLPTGHKNPEVMGAVKTPGLRSLTKTAPYMHNGSEKTLEEVVEFYDRGGNANEFLSPKMRDTAAEAAYLASKNGGPKYTGPEVTLCGPNQKPIVPLKLNLTKAEKAALVLFLRALESDPVDPVVADPDRLVTVK